MSAYAMHLLRTENTREVSIHPDGLHGQQFDFSRWLGRRGFKLSSAMGHTSYGGTYIDERGCRIIVNPKFSLGDVVADLGGIILSAECKGGIINAHRAGQVSRLNKGLCEMVGRLIATPLHGRQIAVVPYTEPTLRLAQKLAPRCTQAGIEIALVKSRGEVIDVQRAIEMAPYRWKL